MKKLAIIGKGTAGCLSIAHYMYYTDWEIDWYYDPETKAQPVGEGGNLAFPPMLFKILNFDFRDLKNLQGTSKLGIRKIDWSLHNQDFTHLFVPGQHSYHFDATILQKYVEERFESDVRVKMIEKRIINNEDVDADFVMDCSGKPKSLENFTIPKHIPVNAVHVTQCEWERPEFEVTIALAMRHGWVFLIPLQNRCSVGYLYNADINTLDDIKSDVPEVFTRFNLTPTEKTNSFRFDNYVRNENFKGRISYNGNASFFLDPMEATSLTFVEQVLRISYDIWHGSMTPDQGNYRFRKKLKEIEQMIMLHYAAGSIYKSKFWDYAKQNGMTCLKELLNDAEFVDWFNNSPQDNFMINDRHEYATWSATSFKQHFLEYKLV